MFSVTFESFNFDKLRRSFFSVVDDAAAMELYGVKDSSMWAAIREQQGEYCNTWIRTVINSGADNLIIHSVDFEIGNKEQANVLLSISGLLTDHVWEAESSSEIRGVVECDINVLNKEEEAIIEEVQDANFFAVILYAREGENNIREVRVPVDTSCLQREALASEEGFRIKMDICEIYELEIEKTGWTYGSYEVPEPVRKQIMENQEQYRLCVFRGVKIKDMPYPVLGVEFHLDSATEIWISKTNGGVYGSRTAMMDDNADCDNMLANDSEYIEARMIIYIGEEQASASEKVEEKLKGTEVSVWFSVEGFGNLEELSGDTIYGPKNRTPIDLSQLQFIYKEKRGK